MFKVRESRNYEIFENIKLVASERGSFNIVPKMVLFPKIYIKIYTNLPVNTIVRLPHPVAEIARARKPF